MEKVVVLLISRNKDNKHLVDFKERRITKFVEFDYPKIMSDFNKFVAEGRKSEFCRLYISLAVRDEKKVQKKLIHALVDEEVDLTKIEAKIVSLAMQPECAVAKPWLFDFDILDARKAQEFADDIRRIDKNVKVHIASTPNGHSITTNRGFDVRPLFEKWESFGVHREDLKKDPMILMTWREAK